MTQEQTNALIAGVWVIGFAILLLITLAICYFYNTKLENDKLKERNEKLKDKNDMLNDKNEYLERKILWYEAEKTFKEKINESNRN